MSIIEEKILERIKEYNKKLPKFPDGRIDYTNFDTPLVLTVFIKYKNRILIFKRSNKVGTYQGKWNTVTGYLDEPKPLIQKIMEEMQEELGIKKDNILSYSLGEPFKFTDPKAKKTWIIHPAKIELKNKPYIKLDWEHTEYKWIKPEELKKFDTVPRLDLSLKKGLM
jgi:isopentenyldiphosphate isomerase